MIQKTILLVDDDLILAKAVALTLSKCDYKVIISNTGEKAVAIASSDDSIDLVLMDIDLGKGIDGTEAAKQILKIRDIPIVFLTSHPDKEFVDRVKTITRFGFVIKSSGEFVLQSSIEMAFELFKTQKTIQTKILKLNESEAKYRSLYEDNHSIILMIKAESGEIVDANVAACKFYGWNKKELCNKNILDLSAANTENILLQIQNSVYSLNSSIYTIQKLKNEEVRDVEVFGGQINVARSPLFYLIIHNISERKKNEEKLLAVLQAVEQSPASIVITDLDGSIEYVNKKFISVTGYSFEEAIGKNPRILKSNLLSQKVYENLWQTILSGKEWIGEFHNIKKSGEIYWERALIAPIIDSSGKLLKLLAVKEDITERKAKEEELARLNLINEENLIKQKGLITELEIAKTNLEKSNSEKDKFFSIIAHDLKSPFQGFLGITKMMADDVNSFTLNDIVSVSKNLNIAATNLYKLLENLLEWAQMQKGTITFDPKECLLSDIIKPNVEAITPRAVQKKISIINSIKNGLKVYADERMLNTVLRNLISNAVKFTRADGAVAVSAKNLNKKFIQISITDNGVGIKEKELAKLFKVGEKVGTTGTDGERSTGLGLILCKEFVEKNGGTIWVTSRPDEGSSFFFTLPKFQDS